VTAAEPAAPLVTIGVICFNQGRYLDEALASVAAQDYPHLEVLVVDDGSSDGSADTAREVLDSRGMTEATLLADGVNRGLGTRLNEVLGKATGEWVVWLAADDQLEPGAVRALVQAADPTTGVVFGDLAVIDEHGRSRGYARPRDSWQRATALRYRDRAGLPLPDMFRVNNFVPGGMALIRQQVLRDAGGYDPAVRTEDFDMWLRIGWTTKVRYVAAPVGRYRVVPGSTSRSERVNTLDQAAIMAKHWASADPKQRRGYARLAAMRWALAVGRGRGRSAVTLREVSQVSGIPMAQLVRVAPAAAVRPIAGAVWSAARLGVQRVRGGRR
jgi:glycosyltransferase involved in cell wall biosynthesis